jgi:hypothetical protein
MSRTLENKISRAQYAAGRIALGLETSRVANEFIEGELGWSSFRAREAQSKIRYFARVQAMSEDRWPKAILSMMDILNAKTTVRTRMELLNQEYSCEDIRVTRASDGRPLFGSFKTKVSRTIKDIETGNWRRAMEAKSSLTLYGLGMTERGVKPYFYDNSRGSTLLALSRAGMLQTRSLRNRIDPDQDSTCRRCGMVAEDLRHVLFECNEGYFSDEETMACLGLGDHTSLALVKSTKKILERWEKETRNIR